LSNKASIEVEVVIERYTFERIMALAYEMKNTECGGMLKVDQTSKRVLRIADTYIPKQKVTGGSYIPDEFEFHEWLEREGLWTGDKLPYATFGIWHSHGMGGGSSFSHIDDEHLVEKFVTRGYLVNMVVDGQRNFTIRVDTLLGSDDPEEALLVTVPHRVRLEQPHYPKLKGWVDESLGRIVRAYHSAGRGRQHEDPRDSRSGGKIFTDDDWEEHFRSLNALVSEDGKSWVEGPNGVWSLQPVKKGDNGDPLGKAGSGEPVESRPTSPQEAGEWKIALTPSGINIWSPAGLFLASLGYTTRGHRLLRECFGIERKDIARYRNMSGSGQATLYRKSTGEQNPFQFLASTGGA
jgi:hypothetical protein